MRLRSRLANWRDWRRQQRALSPGKAALISVPLRLDWEGGYFDQAEFDPSGVVRLVGWSQAALNAIVPPPVAVNGAPVPFLKMYRTANAAVTPGAEVLVAQSGLVLEYRLAAGAAVAIKVATLRVGDHTTAIDAGLVLMAPHYGALLESCDVLSRDSVYASGPPSPVADPALLALIGRPDGSVLDFGCGSGAVIDWLCRHDVDAYGLELQDRFPALLASVQDRVTLYDGSFPTQFAAGSFSTVIASEVLEHIHNWQGALDELARLTSHKLVISVPDAEAIPLGFRHRLVPWHLLESTHLHFFTQASLQAALRPLFRVIEFGRRGTMQLNDTRYFESLVAVCEK